AFCLLRRTERLEFTRALPPPPPAGLIVPARRAPADPAAPSAAADPRRLGPLDRRRRELPRGAASGDPYLPPRPGDPAPRRGHRARAPVEPAGSPRRLIAADGCRRVMQRIPPSTTSAARRPASDRDAAPAVR